MTDATTKAKEGLVLRSLLFVPVNVDKFVAKAHTRGADAIILDLEDSIAASEKATARTLVSEAAERVSQRGADVFVRINSPLRLGIPDLEAAIQNSLAGPFQNVAVGEQPPAWRRARRAPLLLLAPRTCRPA